MCCENCKWYHARRREFDYETDGECRIHAPQRLLKSQGLDGFQESSIVDGWPRVSKNAFCGDFSRKEAA